MKYWITFNEPWVVAWLGYGGSGMAPGRNEPAKMPYIVAHNIIIAHAQTYKIYKSKYRSRQKGQVGITLNIGWAQPKNTSDAADWEASERAIQFEMGWFAHPILVNGDYPQVMKDQIGNKSQAQGYSTSRLPTFSKQEKQDIKGVYIIQFIPITMYQSQDIESDSDCFYDC